MPLDTQACFHYGTESYNRGDLERSIALFNEVGVLLGMPLSVIDS